MILLLRAVRCIAAFAVLFCCMPCSAADSVRRSIIIDNAQTVEDITQQFPAAGMYNLRVRFADAVAPDSRTEILTNAFAHPDADRIVRLDIALNRLEKAPVLTGLSGLQELEISFNSLLEPPVLTGLSRLKILLITYNKLSAPPVLTGLTQLQVLDLEDNNLLEPPLLDGLSNLEVLNLSDNSFYQPVIIPLGIADKINLEYIGAPFKVERLDTTLVDIATPAVDKVPFFFTQDTISSLPVPKLNPLTRHQITHAMNLVESWRYWRDHGMSASDFDAKLQEIEPVKYEENIYTVSRDVAREFLQERGMNERQIKKIFTRLRGDDINISALLELMHSPQIERLSDAAVDDEVASLSLLQTAVDLVEESCRVS